MPGVVRVPDPYKYRSPLYQPGDSDAVFARKCLDQIEEVIMYEGPHTIAAIFIETVTGTNGLIVPPDGYLQGLRALCDKYGILLVCDEVMCGLGRTGAWFAVDHWNVVPDLVTPLPSAVSSAAAAFFLMSSYTACGSAVVRCDGYTFILYAGCFRSIASWPAESLSWCCAAFWAVIEKSGFSAANGSA